MGLFYKDVETGWYYLNSRYYNPKIGRFINADGLLGSTGDILSHNMYAYAKNNPVMMIDPSGYNAAQAIFNWGFKISATLAMIDGPLPFGDTAALVIAGGTVVVGGGYLIYENWDSITSTVSNTWSTVTAKIDSSIQKVLDKTYKHGTELHHIVPQARSNCPEAYDTITKTLNWSIHDPRNTVRLSTNMHKVIHSNEYKTFINYTIPEAYDVGYALGGPTGGEMFVSGELELVRVTLETMDKLYGLIS